MFVVFPYSAENQFPSFKDEERERERERIAARGRELSKGKENEKAYYILK